MPALTQPVIPPGGLSRHRQPTLTVDELVLRPWELSDAAGVESAYRDPAIIRWHARTMTETEAQDWVLSWSQRWSAETGAGWAILEAGQLVGRMGFGVNLSAGSGEAAFWVTPQARGRAVAARALTAATDWMFTAVGFHRLSLLHSVLNRPSCRVAEKSAYRFEGTARGQALHADGWHDMHVHARLSGDGAGPDRYAETPAG